MEKSDASAPPRLHLTLPALGPVALYSATASLSFSTYPMIPLPNATSPFSDRTGTSSKSVTVIVTVILADFPDGSTAVTVTL